MSCLTNRSMKDLILMISSLLGRGPSRPLGAEMKHSVEICEMVVHSVGIIYRPGNPDWEYTMWKFKEFSATQI